MNNVPRIPEESLSCQSSIDSKKSSGLTCRPCATAAPTSIAGIAREQSASSWSPPRTCPTEYGRFHILGFVNNKDGKDHTITLKGSVGGRRRRAVPDRLGLPDGRRLRQPALRLWASVDCPSRGRRGEGSGLVLYQQAEGRGIGLTNKLRAYVLQDRGQDTLEANQSLGFLPDERDYAVPVEMLRKIGVKSVRLLTNNPEKVAQLTQLGIRVVERVPLQLSAHKDNERYLQTKKHRFGHWLYF